MWLAMFGVTSYECGKGVEGVAYLKDSGADDCDCPFSRNVPINLLTLVQRDRVIGSCCLCLDNDGFSCSVHSSPTPSTTTSPGIRPDQVSLFHTTVSSSSSSFLSYFSDITARLSSLGISFFSFFLPLLPCVQNMSGKWVPTLWRKPKVPSRESVDCKDNLCRNKHYSCI